MPLATTGQTANRKLLSSELFIFLTVYAVCLFSLLPRLSLWLDELIDLSGIKTRDVRALIAWVPLNAGGVPLSYLLRSALCHLWGFSAFAGRLPSALFSLAACAGLYALAQRAELKRPLTAVLLFAAMPLQFRYALESRPYAQAAAIGVWLTVLFLQLIEVRKLSIAAAYTCLLIAGLYTQPFTIFVPLSHLLWVLCIRVRDRRQLLFLAGLPVVISTVAFLPWYVWASEVWRQSLESHPARYEIGPHSLLLVVRELTGAGYLGTAILALAAALGVKERRLDRLLWILYVAVPILLALLADAVFGYFVAIRQMIFVLPPLCLLAAAGMESLSVRKRSLAAAVLAAAFLISDVRLFSKPREDWRAAAQLLEQKTRGHACFIALPHDSVQFYEFFSPELQGRECAGGPGSQESVAVAVSPYFRDSRTEEALRTQLASARFKESGRFNQNGPRVLLFER